MRKLIISHVTDKLKSSATTCNEAFKELPINSFSIKYNKASNDIEYNLHIRKETVDNLCIDGVDNISQLTDKKGINNLIFKLNKSKFMSEILNNISKNPNSFLQKSELFETLERKKILIEFSSPNIAKPFHMGHLRSTIIGNFISNINASLNQKVVKINYLGDWGTQFGFLNVGLEINSISDEEIAKNPIQTLYNAYVSANKEAETNPKINDRAREIFRQLEDGSFPELKRWEKFREYTVQELESTYDRLGVKFDEYQWESMFGAKDIQDVLQNLVKNDILITAHDGKQVAKINPDRQVTLVKSDGSTLYLTRDLAAARYRFSTHKFDQLLYVVDSSQSDHFTAMKHLLGVMGHEWSDRITHIKFGRVQGMSTRKGNVVFLRDILDEAKTRVVAKQQQTATTRVDQNIDTADVLAVSAVIVNDLKQRRQRDYDFDWDRALQMQGDGGIKLQYTHCRLYSLEEKSSVSPAVQCNPELLCEPEACALVAELAKFDHVLDKSYRELEACILTNYLFSLSALINSAFKHLPVKGQEKEKAEQRLLLFKSARIVLKKGLNILGLTALDKM